MNRGMKLVYGTLTAAVSIILSTSAHAQLEITEVMYNPTDENAWEWIEVRNTGASAIDLNGYVGFNLGDADITSGTCGTGPCPTINNTLPPSSDNSDTTIQPGEVAVIYDGSFGAGNPQNYVDNSFRTAWGLSAGAKLIAADFYPAVVNTEGAQGQSIGFWANETDWRADQTPVEDDPIGNPGVFTNRTTSFAHAVFSLDFADDAFPAPDGMSSMTWTGNGSNQSGGNWVNSQNGVNAATTSTIFTYTGSTNSTNDVGNPGIVTGTPAVAASELIFTEIMYDPASPETDPRWEWVEIYNTTAAPIDLTGWVFDDNDSAPLTASNIAGGVVPAGGTAILYNDLLSQAEFEAAWGVGLNLISVSGWSTTAMGLANGGDTIALWDSLGDYTGDSTTHANARISFAFPDSSTGGPSIFLPDASLDPLDPGNWTAAAAMDAFGSFTAMALSGTITHHPGGDVGSPGTFTVVTGTPGDFDGDGDVDGRDFLEWQRGNSPDPLSAGDLADWQANYGAGSPLAAVAAVPEPSAALLAVALGLAACCVRKRG